MKRWMIAVLAAVWAMPAAAQQPCTVPVSAVVRTADSAHVTVSTSCAIPRDTIRVTDTVRVVDTVRVQPDTTTPAPAPAPAPQPTTSREPSGFTRLTVNEPAFVPPYPTANGWGSYPYPSSRIAAIATTVPSGDGSAMEITLPAGMASGSGGEKLWPRLNSLTSRRMYTRLNIRLEGTAFEGEMAYTKLVYWGYGRDYSSAKNDGILGLSGSGVKGQVKQCWTMEFRQQNNVTRNLRTNGQLCAGQWAKIEVLLQLNTLGSANGRLTIWKDGVVILDRTDMVFITSGYENPFHHWYINPVWGGNNGYTKSRTDKIRFDGIYVSGS